MNEEQKAKILEYEELKIQEKQLKEKVDAVKAEIEELIPEDEKVNCAHGFIEKVKRDNWTYTPETTQLAKDLKDKQKEEVAKGLATNNPTVFIQYRSKDKEYEENN